MDLVINDTLADLPTSATSIAQYGGYWLNILAVINKHKEDLPLGDLLKSIHGLSGQWAVMSPVYWQATHNDAFIVAAGDTLLFAEEESRTLFNAITQFLAEETLYYHDAYHWLINVDDKPELHSEPPALILNQSLMPALNRMDSSMYWQRLFTEVQMFLASQKDLAQSMINAFWFYGSGRVTIDDCKTIFTDDVQLLSVYPEKLKPLSNESPVTKHAVWVCTKPRTIPSSLFSKPTNWYWNNNAYTLPAQNWWKKLLSKLRPGE